MQTDCRRDSNSMIGILAGCVRTFDVFICSKFSYDNQNRHHFVKGETEFHNYPKKYYNITNQLIHMFLIFSRKSHLGMLNQIQEREIPQFILHFSQNISATCSEYGTHATLPHRPTYFSNFHLIYFEQWYTLCRVDISCRQTIPIFEEHNTKC